jgi:hypothetical protein
VYFPEIKRTFAVSSLVLNLLASQIGASFCHTLYMNLVTRPRGRPRNRWQDEVREDGRIVGGEEWQEKVYNREEWKKLLRTARNCRILHMPME